MAAFGPEGIHVVNSVTGDVSLGKLGNSGRWDKINDAGKVYVGRNRILAFGGPRGIWEVPRPRGSWLRELAPWEAKLAWMKT